MHKLYKLNFFFFFFFLLFRMCEPIITNNKSLALFTNYIMTLYRGLVKEDYLVLIGIIFLSFL